MYNSRMRKGDMVAGFNRGARERAVTAVLRVWLYVQAAFRADATPLGSALQESHQESTLALRRSLTCCVFELPRGGSGMRFDQQHLNVLGLLPSEEASREVSLGSLVDDLGDSK